MLSVSMQYKSIRHTKNLYNGGFLAYWNLYGQLLKQISKKDELISKIRAAYPQFIGKELEEKVKWEFFKLKLFTYTLLFFWACLLKPFGQFVSRTVTINGDYMLADDGYFENKNIVKNTRYKLLGITIWYSTNQKLTEEEIKELKK
jgi:hypothetical protein